MDNPGVCNPHEEEGFTIVELMVSLTVLTVGVVAVLGVFNSTFSVAAGAATRSKAVSLATREIEAVRAKDYADIAVAGGTTRSTEKVGGRTYTIEQWVNWADASHVTSAYKEGTVSVSWSDHLGLHEVRQTTIVYPGGLGPHATSTTIPVGLSVTAALAADELVATLSPGLAVDLSWNVGSAGPLDGISRFVVQYSTSPSFSTWHEYSANVPSGSRELQVTGLSADTKYKFRIASVASDGKLSDWTYSGSVTTGTSSGACSLGTPAITPSSVKRKPPLGGSWLEKDPVFSVNTSGTCAGLAVGYQPTGLTQSLALVPSGGGHYTATLPGGVPWDVGPHLVELYEGATKRGQVLLTVCEHQAKGCG